MPVEIDLRPQSLNAQVGAVHIISYAGASATVVRDPSKGSLFSANLGSHFSAH
jgi:hypothetical protein